MPVKTKKKPATKIITVRKKHTVGNEEIEQEIKLLKSVIEVKKDQTTNNIVTDEQLKKLEVNGDNEISESNDTSNPVQNEDSKVLNTNETVTEVLDKPSETATEITTEPKKKNSLFDEMSNVTQEDLTKKEIKTEDLLNEFSENKGVEDRLNDATDDNFVTNEGATEDEDTPEYRREMSKIKASALVEFFDVIFMIICLAISKDFSDANQIKFSLVKTRKNAIKANVFQILAFSKKKHNPMGTVIFLVLFSYVPLIAIAVMDRIKQKKLEQERIKANEERLYLESIKQPVYNNPVFTPSSEFNTLEVVKKPRKSNKIVSVHEQSGAKVKQNKDGSYTNLTTGEKYNGGRGRKPSWLKQYIGKIG